MRGSLPIIVSTAESQEVTVSLLIGVVGSHGDPSACLLFPGLQGHTLSYVDYLELVSSESHFYLTSVFPHSVSALVLGLGLTKKTQVSPLPLAIQELNFTPGCPLALWIFLLSDLTLSHS